MNLETQVPVRKILVSQRDAAAALSLSLRTVQLLINRGELVAVRVGKRTLVLASSLESFARVDHGSPKQRGELAAAGV